MDFGYIFFEKRTKLYALISEISTFKLQFKFIGEEGWKFKLNCTNEALSCRAAWLICTENDIFYLGFYGNEERKKYHSPLRQIAYLKNLVYCVLQNDKLELDDE